MRSGKCAREKNEFLAITIVGSLDALKVSTGGGMEKSRARSCRGDLLLETFLDHYSLIEGERTWEIV
jgi:hypothetical protein